MWWHEDVSPFAKCRVCGKFHPRNDPAPHDRVEYEEGLRRDRENAERARQKSLVRPKNWQARVAKMSDEQLAAMGLVRQ